MRRVVTMSDNKKYYFLKLKDSFFDSEGIKVLESMPNGIYYSNLLIKLYLKSLRSDGILKLNGSMPYNEKMLSALTNLEVKHVRNGLELLTSLGFIEKLEDGTIYMKHLKNFVGKSNSETDRKRIYRDKINEDRDILEQISPKYILEAGTGEGTFSEKCPPENRDKSIELRAKSLDNREIETREKINSLSVSLLKDFEDKTGTIGSINLGAMKNAVELHGAENVQRAIDTALEKNKPTMTYINGILKNWAADGYPEEGEKNGNGSSVKNNEPASNEFAGFKPKEPRCLEEGEREALERELL
jgi:predicted phage replisome organizer